LVVEFIIVRSSRALSFVPFLHSFLNAGLVPVRSAVHPNLSDGCTSCVSGYCTAGRCGQFCQNNPSICNNASDGCNMCIGGTCQVDTRFISSCGLGCWLSSQCSSQGGGCTSCVGGQCVNPNTDRSFSKCGLFCRNNAQVCNGDASNGCPYCNASTGTCTSNGNPTCGSSCLTNNECRNAPVGCSQCFGGSCGGNRNTGFSNANSETTLRSQLEAGGTITLQAGVTISVSNVITTSKNNVVLQCSGNSCIIRGSGNSNGLLRFNGQSIQIRGITFQSGRTSGSGGAVYISGGNNIISGCTFIGNHASQRGGAVYAGGLTTLSGNSYAGNFAGQCTNVYDQGAGCVA